MDHKNDDNVDENNKNCDLKTDKTVDESDSELHSIYKNLLIDLKQEFGPQFEQKKILKRVAKLEKTANKLNNQFINQFNVILVINSLPFQLIPILFNHFLIHLFFLILG